MRSLKKLLKKLTPSKNDSGETTTNTSHDEEPVQSKPLFFPNQTPSDFFSHPKMSDLSEVGKTKALGYLPLDAIRSSGFELFQVTLSLKKSGLKFFIIPNPLPEEMYAYDPHKKKYVRMSDNAEYKVIPKGGFLSIRSGALVAYDEKAVNDLLKENEKIIKKENSNEANPEDHWPLQADDFVNMLFRKRAESVEMDCLVSKIFQEMPNRSTSDLSMN